MYSIGIRYLIPALFVMFALFEGGVGYYTGIRDAVELTKQEALQEFQVDMARQQETIEMLLRSDHLGTLRLYIASLATSEAHLISLYVNQDQEVLSSTNLSLVGMQLSEIANALVPLDIEAINSIRKGEHSHVSYGDKEHEYIVTGYLEICYSGKGYYLRGNGCGLFIQKQDIAKRILI